MSGLRPCPRSRRGYTRPEVSRASLDVLASARGIVFTRTARQSRQDEMQISALAEDLGGVGAGGGASGDVAACCCRQGEKHDGCGDGHRL